MLDFIFRRGNPTNTWLRLSDLSLSAALDAPSLNKPAMQAYGEKVERHRKLFYDTLSEKDRRRYAAWEAEKLGHGGCDYVAGVLGCHPSTIRQGKEDLAQLPNDPAADRVRKKGGTQKLS